MRAEEPDQGWTAEEGAVGDRGDDADAARRGGGVVRCRADADREAQGGSESPEGRTDEGEGDDRAVDEQQESGDGDDRQPSEHAHPAMTVQVAGAKPSS